MIMAEKSMDKTTYSTLKIHASTTDRIGSKVLYEYIVGLAMKQGIRGATVYRGIMGFGSSSGISSSKFWELTEKLPVVIELVDETKKLERFYREIEKDLLGMKKGCLVALEPTEILLQKKGN
jgi:PII-like signaling protein